MNLISADIPTISCCLKFARTCVLNTYMGLKLNKLKSIFDNEIYNHTSFIVSYKISVPFSRGPDIEPLSGRFFIDVCVCRERGCFDVVFLLFFCNAIFSKSELKPKSFSCQSNSIWKIIFIRNVSNTFFCLDLLAKLPYLCRLRFSCFARLKRTYAVLPNLLLTSLN